MNLLVENNHVVGVEPRYDFPVNEGRLCPKGVTAYLQVHHPDRLLHPLIKRNGRFERATVCTFQLANAINFPRLLVIPRYFIYLALAGWIAALLGLIGSLVRSASR